MIDVTALAEYEDQSDVTQDQLTLIRRACERQRRLASEVEACEEKLSDTKAQLRNVSESVIPDLLDEAGVSEIKLDTGEKVTVRPFYTGEANGQEQFDWLEANGHGDIISNQVIVDLGKGVMPGVADTVLKLLDEAGYTTAVNKQGVHFQTMRGWVREQVENGEETPMSLFKIYIGRKAHIK